MNSGEEYKAAVTIQRHVRGIQTRARHKQFVNNLKAHKYITNEILSSERGYVKSLDTIINVFYKPLKQSKVVDQAIINTVFANIVEIHGIHVTLLNEMADTPHLLGTVFHKNIPAFRAYRPYVANYTTSLTTYNALIEKKPFLDTVKACCNTNNGLQPSDLPALLNKPVVQLARYKLLLDDLLSKTNPQNEDMDSLQKAVVLLKQVVEGESPHESNERPVSPFSSASSEKSMQSLQSTSSSASLARKLNAIAQTPHNLPYKLSPFVSRSVSSTPNSLSNYDPGDPSLPSYLRPTHTSYARANEGRAKKDQVTYTINNTPTWMPNGNPHSEKIYNTVYNAIPYTPNKDKVLDRNMNTLGVKTWMPAPATPRSFDNGMARSSSSLSVRDDLESPRTPKKSPSKVMSSSLTPSSAKKLLFDAPPPTTPTKPTPSTSSSTSAAPHSTTPVKPIPSTPRSHAPTSGTTPSKTSTPSSAKTPTKIPTSSSTHATPTKPASSSNPKPATTPSKSVVAAARAAGSNIPSPRAATGKPTPKSGLPKTPSQGSKIPVLKSPRGPASQNGNDDGSPNGKHASGEEENQGNEDEDETMTF